MAGDQKKSVSPPKFPSQKPTQFTVDEKTGSKLHTMPSINRLLNRKKLEPQKPSPPSISSAISPTIPPALKTSMRFQAPETPIVAEVQKEEYPPIVFDLSQFGIETGSPPDSHLDSQANFQANSIAKIAPPSADSPAAGFIAKDGISLVLDTGEPESVKIELMNSGSSLAHVAAPSSSSNYSGDLSGLSLGLSFAAENENESLSAAVQEPAQKLDEEPVLSSEFLSLGDELDALDEVIEEKTPKLLVTKSAKLRFSASPQLHFWDSKTLKNTKDPLAEGITLLLEKGASSALFMTLIPPPIESSLPHFETRALTGDRSKENLWTGMKWNPAIVPHVWNSFIHPGWIELSPPGTQTDQMSQRNVMRGALGLRMDEFLVFVRIGPENACRGALAVISKKSMVLAIEAAMKFLAQKAPDITLAA